MNTEERYDEIFESAMREDPGYKLPNSFVDGVSSRIARKLALKIQVRMLWRSALILVGLTLLVFVFNYFIASYYPKLEKFTINGYFMVVVTVVVLFILFMDRVVLSYLENRHGSQLK